MITYILSSFIRIEKDLKYYLTLEKT